MSDELGALLGPWALAPFVCMLLAVAILPVVAGGWFHRNRNKAIVAAVLGVPTVVYLVVRFPHLGLESVAGTAEEYVSFIVLLLALYTISGGIFLSGNLIATPGVNLAFLGSGALLANLIGTMGASMVLIRPLLRANSERMRARHTLVFFIFAVSNIGGMLTPLGDPPLFLGFLRGVPFFWTFHLWPQWLLTLALTLGVYAVLEIVQYRREPAVTHRWDVKDYVPLRINGWLNVLLLGMVTVTVIFSDPLVGAGRAAHFPFLRELILVVLAGVSLRYGPREPRTANRFYWAPMVEVAVVFAGIFATMIPALALLRAHGAGAGVSQPWQYFWSTGVLSAFLDNAPTYLAFTSLAQGQFGVATVGALTSSQIVPGLGFSSAAVLAAISCGAVMMGALTYIGNAPNYTVRSIAERDGVAMPSFFGFMGYSVPVLIPIFALVTVLFWLL